MSDTTWDHLQSLRDCALDNVEPLPCRTFIHPGVDAPWDTCTSNEVDGTDGQLWVAHLRTTPGWPPAARQASTPRPCEHQDTAFFELGIIRCAKGVVRDDGSPPDEDNITADSEQQQADRWSLREAIACCFETDRRNVLMSEWVATSPLGGCVGGTWEIAVRIGNCSCQGES